MLLEEAIEMVIKVTLFLPGSFFGFEFASISPNPERFYVSIAKITIEVNWTRILFHVFILEKNVAIPERTFVKWALFSRESVFTFIPKSDLAPMIIL